MIWITIEVQCNTFISIIIAVYFIVSIIVIEDITLYDPRLRFIFFIVAEVQVCLVFINKNCSRLIEWWIVYWIPVEFTDLRIRNFADDAYDSIISFRNILK